MTELPSGKPLTLFEKLWERHVAAPETEDHPAVVYIDLHLIHEVTSPQAFDELKRRGLAVRRPDRTVATMDHSIPTLFDGDKPLFADEKTRSQVETLQKKLRRVRDKSLPDG